MRAQHRRALSEESALQTTGPNKQVAKPAPSIKQEDQSQNGGNPLIPQQAAFEQAEDNGKEDGEVSPPPYYSESEEEEESPPALPRTTITIIGPLPKGEQRQP